MSQVIWVNSLIDGEVKADESDKPYLLRFAGRLDRLCDGQREFSDFIDYTESRAVISGDYQGFKDGWELIKHKGSWYEPEEGLTVLTALIEKIEREKPRFGLFSDKSGEVLSELKQCLAALEKIASAQGRFHFGVVM
jgi:hypothetical protein